MHPNQERHAHEDVSPRLAEIAKCPDSANRVPDVFQDLFADHDVETLAKPDRRIAQVEIGIGQRPVAAPALAPSVRISAYLDRPKTRGA